MGMIGFRVVILVYKVRARHDSPLKLGMVGLDACIEHCRHDRRVAFGDLPSFHGINIRIGRPPALPRVMKMPLFRKKRIVRDKITALSQGIRLGVFHQWTLTEYLTHRTHRLSVCKL